MLGSKWLQTITVDFLPCPINIQDDIHIHDDIQDDIQYDIQDGI